MFHNLFFQVALITTTLIPPATASGHIYNLTMDRSNGQAPEETIAQVTFDSTMWVEHWFGKKYADGASIQQSVWSSFAKFQVMRYAVVQSKVRVNGPFAWLYKGFRKLSKCCVDLPKLKHKEVWLEVKDLDKRKWIRGVAPTYVVRVFWAYGPEGHEKDGQLELSIALNSPEDVVIAPMQSSRWITIESPLPPVDSEKHVDNTWTQVDEAECKSVIGIIKMFRDWRYKLVEGHEDAEPREGNCQTATAAIQAYLHSGDEQEEENSMSRAVPLNDLAGLIDRVDAIQLPEEQKSQTGPARRPSGGASAGAVEEVN